MARASDRIDRFGRFLAQSEHSPLTVKNYRGDLKAFAAWFEQVNGEAMSPSKVTPTDLRQCKRWLVEQRKLKPSSVNRKLATLKSFLTWATAAGFAPGLPVPAQGRTWSGLRPVPQERPGPRVVQPRVTEYMRTNVK
jgi:site-specific recombinase XerD